MTIFRELETNDRPKFKSEASARRFVGKFFNMKEMEVLSDPDKMPEFAFNIPAYECKAGGHMVGLAGFICHECYALPDLDEDGNIIIALFGEPYFEIIYETTHKQKTIYERYGYKTAMDEQTYRAGKIKSNSALANVMNSFTDNQIAGLIASGAVNQELIDEYLKGQNINLDFDISQLTNNTSRQMGFTDVSENVVLSKVLNSMSDQQVYELLASGTIDSGLVNKYIQDGANAPILPCGSSDCEMFPTEILRIGSDGEILTNYNIENIETPDASDFQELTKDIADLTKEELGAQIDEINQASDDLMQTIAGIDGAVPEDLAAAAAAAGAARDAANEAKRKRDACNANPDEC